MPPRLKLTGIQKAFGATQALRGVTLEVAPGEVHALIGENGAGKSTLMKVLSGAHVADSGEIELDGRPFTPRDPLHARRCGVAMIYQELTLAPHLSVEENLLLGEEPARFGWIRGARRRDLAHAALAELDAADIPPDVPVQELPIARQQLVEIARALIGEPKVLIMDEPTSSLPRAAAEHLFAVIARLKQRGVSVIYISHFLEECERVCDHYTVLRDGMNVAGGQMASANVREIIHHMVGREVDEFIRARHTNGGLVLDARAGGRWQTRDVSLKAARGRDSRYRRPDRGRTDIAALLTDPVMAGKVTFDLNDRRARHRRSAGGKDGL